MTYTFEEKTIEQLINLIDKDSVDLNPSYQRNFIWSTKDQESLLDSILLGYPLPNFFIYKKTDENYEMVDGQQRSKTIYRFVKGNLTSSKLTGKIFFKEVEQKQVLNYKLPFVIIENLKGNESMNDFYVLINKKGKQLNIPEVHKSEFHDTLFMKLANELLSYQKFIQLDLFTDAASRRMNDRDFVQELIGFLKEGIKDKKKFIEEIFRNDIDDNEYIELQNKFTSVIDVLVRLNEITPIKNTRYKQKNDFYTLFVYVFENINLDIKLLEYQYQILLLLNGKDSEGLQFIRPTNSDCPPLKEYATHCVSQSNSKNARIERLRIFNAVLKNKNIVENKILQDIMRYLSNIYGNESIQLINIDEFKLLNLKLIK